MPIDEKQPESQNQPQEQYEAPTIIEKQIIQIQLQTNFLPDEPPPPL